MTKISKKNRLNGRRSGNRRMRNNYKIGGSPIPKYLYLIHTNAACADGEYLMHVRYIGFNLKDAFTYFRSLFTVYEQLRANKTSSIHESYIERIRNYSIIGKHYLELADQDEWLQTRSNTASTAVNLDANSAFKLHNFQKLVDKGENLSAFDGYAPQLSVLDIESGTINRSEFYHTDDISDERVQSDFLRRLVTDEGTIPEESLSIINDMDIIRDTTINIQFLEELGLFTSWHVRPDPKTVNDTRKHISEQYPCAKELNSIELVPSSTVKDYKNVFEVPENGLDVSRFNIVLSDGYFAV